MQPLDLRSISNPLHFFSVCRLGFINILNNCFSLRPILPTTKYYEPYSHAKDSAHPQTMKISRKVSFPTAPLLTLRTDLLQEKHSARHPTQQLPDPRSQNHEILVDQITEAQKDVTRDSDRRPKLNAVTPQSRQPFDKLLLPVWTLLENGQNLVHNTTTVDIGYYSPHIWPIVTEMKTVLSNTTVDDTNHLRQN